MKKFLPLLGLTAASVLLLSFSAQATNYAGNANGSFGGTIGGGMLTLTSNGTTLTGTIQNGSNNAFNDELLIYIDAKAGGFTSTSTFTDTGNNDTLRKATSGFNGTNRAALNFAAGFGADYAIALSPSKANFGSF